MTPYLFFTGKGGVGKTCLASATAVKLADEGKNVLLVSTDPASNLEDVLESKVSESISQVEGLPNLSAINIDPEIAAEEYRSRILEPLKGTLPEEEIKQTEEELSGACTTEIAAFDEFARFISGENEGGQFDTILFDTAPTGHTLRLLELPAAWAEFAEQNPEGASCLGPTSALQSSRERYKKVVANLRDADQTTFYLVARAEASSLKEASRTSEELKALGLSHQKLLINGVFKALDPSDPFAQKMEANARAQLNAIPENLQGLEQQHFPLLPYNVLGLKKLRSLLDEQLQTEVLHEAIAPEQKVTPFLEGIDALVNDLTEGKDHGLIMTMGKGGVGKTITASALALMMARQGHDVHLTTTDPAAHVQDFINQLEALPGNLTIDRIDPKEETRKYQERVLRQKGDKLDEEGRKLLEEDLKSPCTEEVAVFHAFSKAIQKAKRQFVVVDTAPTGHTLMLLDTAGSYHQEVMRNASSDLGNIKTPYMMLQDSSLSKVILVSLPETTPMRESAELQKDLERAGISPHAWVVNQSLSMHPELKDPLLKSRAMAEWEVLYTIREKYADQVYGIPYLVKDHLLPGLLDFYSEQAGETVNP